MNNFRDQSVLFPCSFSAWPLPKILPCFPLLIPPSEIPGHSIPLMNHHPLVDGSQIQVSNPDGPPEFPSFCLPHPALSHLTHQKENSSPSPCALLSTWYHHPPNYLCQKTGNFLDSFLSHIPISQSLHSVASTFYIYL